MAKTPAFKKLTKSLSKFNKYAPKSYTPVLAILLIVAAFLVGVLFTKVQYLEKNGNTVNTTVAGNTQPTTPPAAPVNINTVKGLFKSGNIYFGKANAKNLIVEIADPSCPYCHIAGGQDPEIAKAVGTNFQYVSDGGNYQPPVPEIRKLVDSGQAAYVWVYFPGHTGGEMGSKALYCANEQGKFWETHDLLMSEKGYEIQNGVDSNNNPTKGPVVGNDKTKSADMANFLSGVIDPTFMQNCLDSGKYDSKLQSDITTANDLFKSFDQAGTPGFIINTSVFGGAYSWPDMKSAIKS